MNSLLSYAIAANGLEDALWSLGQRSRVLQELRKDISYVWRDEASREINGRYLNPHESDSDDMVVALGQHHEGLKTVDKHLSTAQELDREVARIATIVEEKVRFANEDLDLSYSAYDQFVHENAESRSRVPGVYELIDRANSAC